MQRILCWIFLSLLLSLNIPVFAASSAVVLMYHRFGEDTYPSTNIRLEQFRAQLELLRSEGYTVIPMPELISALTKGSQLPDRAVVITIDDAYRSIYEVAWPLFQQYQYPFTVFVSTDAVDKGYRSHLSWDQIREMAANNATFANHGASHDSLIKKLSGESDEQRIVRIMADVNKGSERIAAETTLLAGVFAYPYGEYDTGSANALRAAGYLSFGQQSGAVGVNSDGRALPRYPMSGSLC